MFKQKRKLNNNSHEIEPDEIFLDSQNIPEFNIYQLEGRFEKPLPKRVVVLVGVFFVFIGIVFIWKLGIAQIAHGETYFSLAEKNSLNRVPIFAERGIIYDRNGVELAWNKEPENGDLFPYRSYIDSSGFGHVLGYVSYPQIDKAGYFWRENIRGKDGIERQYDEILGGKNGVKLVETNVFGEVQSENMVEPELPGENITLSIDSRIQAKFFESISDLARTRSFEAGAGVLMDIESGEVLALTSFPEYDPEILSAGQDKEAIADYRLDGKKPFLNRAVEGLYIPGSTVKPFLALGALNEKVISPDKKILSTGSISIPNPWDPTQESIFKDWKAHGWVNMVQALAVSSNVYFYQIGGGYESQRGLGISKIEEYFRMFGFNEKTGIDLQEEVKSVIPTPTWKAETFEGDIWRLGDTYNVSIGQYGFQLTPLQMARAIAAVASKGTLVTPHIKMSGSQSIEISKYRDVEISTSQNPEMSTPQNIEIPDDYFDIVHAGLRRAVTSGTASALYLPGVKVAAKTGTAQVGPLKKFVNSWVIGFFPYEKPRYAFAIVMEKGRATNTTGAVYAAKDLLQWMIKETPEYLN